MNSTERLRVAKDRLAIDLAHALGNVPPDIAESALGRTMVADLLVGEAVGLLARDLHWQDARALAASMVAGAGPPAAWGTRGRGPRGVR